jgi:hypothetical protein
LNCARATIHRTLTSSSSLVYGPYFLFARAGNTHRFVAEFLELKGNAAFYAFVSEPGSVPF